MKLLCVEARPDATRVFGEALTRLGHEVSYLDREASLEEVRTRRVDAVLLPFAVDDDLLEAVRRLAPRLPVIALGEEDSALAAARAAARGALGYLACPADGVLQPGVVEVLTGMIGRAAARARFEADREANLLEDLRMRKFYGDVITSVQQGILVIDHKGRVRFSNPIAARILGESDDEDSLFEGRAAVSVLEMLVETLTSGETQNQTLAYEKDEQRIFLDVTASVLRAADGKATGAVATVADRSMEKHLEQQLVHNERLATLGSLLASIAHEINNTLTSVTGCAEMGLELADTAEQQAAEMKVPEAREALEQLGSEVRMIFDMILEAGISAQTIANNMLQYSRQGKPSHRVQENINTLINKTIDVLGKHLGVEKVTLELDLEVSGPQVRIEPAKLQQALVNLVVNAVHALMEVPEERQMLVISTRIDGEHVVLSVRDQGPGMSPARLGRIFQPFFTTKGHGTGLGLYISRRVIEDQGGTLEVESTVGEGTCFMIRLPLAKVRSLASLIEPMDKSHETRVE